jgi:hypothetical protein
MTTRVAEELPHTNKMKLGEIIGFIDGDGSIDEKRGRVSFCNSEQFCILKMLDNFEDVFGISRERFCYYLTVPFKSNSKKIKSTWAENLKVQKNILAYEDRDKKTKKKLGMIRVFLHDASFPMKINDYLERVRLELEKDKDILIGYLRGFFAAEGAVIPGKTRKVIPNSIQFPQKGKDIPEMIKKILDKFGVEGRVVLKQKKADYYCVNITGYDNFKKFYDLGLADLHPEKKEKIKKGLDSYGKVVSRKLVQPTKLLKALNKQSMTRLQIYKFMDSYEQKINGMLYSKTSYLVKNKLISRKPDRKGITYWRITPEGRKFLQKQE